MNEVIDFNEKLKQKKQRTLKGRISYLANVINDHKQNYYLDFNNLSDDLIELEKTYTIVEKLYNSIFYNSIKSSFEKDLIILQNTLRKNKSEFSFPTILSEYRKGIYPIKALYFEVEKCLFTPKRKNKKQKWICNLFKNKTWSNNLIQIIDNDILLLFEFIKKYHEYNYDSIDEKLIELNKFRQDLIQYKNVFICLKK